MTGGLFVKRPEDTEEYFEQKLRAVKSAASPRRSSPAARPANGSPTSRQTSRRPSPFPDGAVDPFRLVVANAGSALEHGARIETHAKVRDLLVEDGEVVGVDVEHGAKSGERVHGVQSGREEIRADHVVNATGAWAGRIGDMAGLDVEVRPSKGVMTIMNVRQVDTVINRCRPKGDADIVVPHETTAILGTTDEEVEDPENYPEKQWEVDQMIDTLSELVPILSEARSIRSFWGVRPLYEPPETGTADPTDITRDYFLLDHEGPRRRPRDDEYRRREVHHPPDDGRGDNRPRLCEVRDRRGLSDGRGSAPGARTSRYFETTWTSSASGPHRSSERRTARVAGRRGTRHGCAEPRGL